MKTRQFNNLLSSLETLTGAQIAQLRHSLEGAHQRRSSIEAIETALPPGCRHCGSAHVVRNGTRMGLQRWLCRDCKRSSSATTGTALSRLRHKHKFEAYARCLAERMSVRQAAIAVDISVDTSFRWRHRFLEAAVEHQPHGVSGLLEVDETYFRYSRKGERGLNRPPRRRGSTRGQGPGRRRGEWVPVLVGRVRGQPTTTDCVLERMTGEAVTQALRTVINPQETIICTDSHGAFKRLRKSLGVVTKRFVESHDGHVRNRVYHVQTVNQYHSVLKGWIQNQMHGVATKYLPHYLAWMRLSRWDRSGISPHDIVASAIGRQVINL